MDLKQYKFNGFKLYELETIVTDSDVSGIKTGFLLVQFKNGREFKWWKGFGGSFEECEDWSITSATSTLIEYNKFIKNLTEEEVFGILL